MQETGFLTRRQRRWAWLGFLATAVNAPVAARFLDDASWLFCACVSAMVAFLLLIDDRTRRMGTARRRLDED
ncbi:MAG TPA: hypothetical protein VFB74_02150 [Kribbellaceae bacterium]|nr:hypothetical protein [Kribbellaceae bacterium]